MIQPNELRIGNLFNPISRNTEVHLPATMVIIKIIEIKAFSVRVILKDMLPATLEDWVEKPIRDLSPITLTPELLEQCGFKNAETDFHGLMDEYSLSIPVKGANENTISFCFPFNKVTEPFGRYSVNNYHASNNFKYLHQLQNIFFTLTGEELDTSKVTPPEFHLEK